MTTLPGRAVGAGRAFTVGENELLPPGPTFFSVGEGAFVVGEAGALELDGAFVSVGFSLVSLLQALSAPIPTMATPPATSANCRVKRDRMMWFPYFLCPKWAFHKSYVRAVCGVMAHGRRLTTAAP